MKLLIIFIPLYFASPLEALLNSKNITQVWQIKPQIQNNDSFSGFKFNLDFNNLTQTNISKESPKKQKNIFKRTLQNLSKKNRDFERFSNSDSKFYLDIDPNSILPIHSFDPDDRTTYSLRSKKKKKIRHKYFQNQEHSSNKEDSKLNKKILSTTTMFPMTTTEKILDYESTPVISPNGQISFHANESLLHYRTESWIISFNNCLELKYHIEGKRTR